MCNFVVQELNRGAVIYGLPDTSGKARPMVLLTDVKPNGRGNYGMTLNAFQIGSGCYNQFELPIKIRWENNSYRMSYISTLHTLQFTQAELLSTSVDYVGIVPKEILDLACRVYTTYIAGDTRELAAAATAVREMRLEFMRCFTDVKYIDYRSPDGGTMRLNANGYEERIVSPRSNLSGAENHGDILIGKDVNRSDSTEAFSKDVGNKPAKATIFVKRSKKPDTSSITPPIIKVPTDPTGWEPNKRVTKQSNDVLRRTLQFLDESGCAGLAKSTGIPCNTIYNRKNKAIDEVYRRYDLGEIELSDSDLEALFRLGGGTGATIVQNQNNV